VTTAQEPRSMALPYRAHSAQDRALEQERLDHSLEGLRRAAPELSADAVLSGRQKSFGMAVLVLLVAALATAPISTLRVVLGVVTVGYTLSLVYRLVLVKRGLRGEHLMHISDQDALALIDDDLPVYSVLVPAYREPEVIGKVIDSLTALNYPVHKLDIRLLLEADDELTILAAQRSMPPGVPITIVLIPVAEPRTKPKACNYGLQGAAGELVTIFDAEDRPEPLQLRRAVLALRRLGPDFACVQARLGYFNARQNLITRWFTVEYATWFGLLLPGLVSVGAPVPLGGTSNHFRVDLLQALGAWDPYNVTEDADLGIRLTRLGYSVGVLDSVTLEEANSDFVNWVKQRSRWYKGYLLTWLVHMRHPVKVHRELGWRGALGLHLFIAGTPVTTALNPVFWALALIWLVQQPTWITALFPAGIFYLGLICFSAGNAAVVYTNAVTTRVMGDPGLLGAALLVPLYWVMMSIAAIKGAFQLAWSPSYWEKTSHGLHEAPATSEALGVPE